MVDLSNVEFAPAFTPLFQKYRFKTWYGGRGAGKSWQIARYLIMKAISEKHRIACLRELQTSIRDSVYQVIKEQIVLMGLAPMFQLTLTSIRCPTTGSEFIFKGLRANVEEIQSMEGVTIVWIEEGQLVSKLSWQILIPTIRVEGSEIITSFNPVEEEDPTYQQLVINQSPDSVTVKVGFRDNPWFPKVLDAQRRWDLESDPDSYEHIWEGSCRVISDAVIFKGKCIIEAFDFPSPPPERLFHGLDFGFANSPLAFVRFWTTGSPPSEELWVDEERVRTHVELDEMETFIAGPDGVATARNWPIKADSARPESISYLRRRGFNVTAAEKWSGSVEDGIAHLKAFKKIHIHQRCKNQQQESRLYRYKTDRLTKEVLPVVMDANNHGWDAIRYGLDGYIHRRGGAGVWAGLVR